MSKVADKLGYLWIILFTNVSPPALISYKKQQSKSMDSIYQGSITHTNFYFPSNFYNLHFAKYEVQKPTSVSCISKHPTRLLLLGCINSINCTQIHQKSFDIFSIDIEFTYILFKISKKTRLF